MSTLSNQLGMNGNPRPAVITGLLLALWIFTNAAMFTTTALAQTEFEIAAKQASLEREYRDELDNWMLRAYEGDQEAQFKVGVLFTNTQFGEADFEQAVYWYKQAARQGHVLAQYNLGHQYLTGVGVAKNERTAMEWWLRAADKDHALAQFNVGRAYYLGIGLEKDQQQSRSWFERAAFNQEPKSIEILQQLGWYDEEKFANSAAPVIASKKVTSEPEPISQRVVKEETRPQKEIEQEVTKAELPETQLPAKGRWFSTLFGGPKRSESNETTPLKSRITAVAKPTEQRDKNTSVTTTSQENSAASKLEDTEEAFQEAPRESELQQSTGKYIPPPVVEIKIERRPATDQTDFVADTATETESAKSTQIFNDTLSLNSTEPIEATATDTQDDTAKASQSTTVAKLRTTSNSDNSGIRMAPVALYTDPKTRSVLITIARSRQELTMLKRGTDWSSVQISSGFPVWVHSDFIEARQSLGTVIGQTVNARSVPIVADGTVVGKLTKGEEVVLIDQRKGWYRVQSPAHFKAWVKTEDFDRPLSEKAYVISDPSKPNGWATRQRGAANNRSQPVSAETAISQSPERVQTTEVSSAAPSQTSSGSTNSVRPINDNAWLFNQSADSYTLQLASFDDPLKVQEFVSRSKFINNPALHRFTASGKEIQWTYFLYGSYPQKGRAEQAKTNIKQRRAWVRTFGRLQQNRCLAWKTQFPTPSELNRYCKQ